MGLSDFLSDLYSSLAMTPLHADAPSGGPSNAPHSDPHSDADTSGAMNDASNQGTGKTATVQQSGAGGVDGGVSNSTPHAGTDEESAAEADVNAQDQQKAGERTAEEPAAGHKPGDGGDASGQTGVPDRVKQNPLNKMDEDDDVPEEEEDEDEEPQDLKPKLEEECMHSKQCAPIKHHYDECVERVTQQMEEGDGKAKEDCVEEFFHLAHCATNCAAPKLFRQLK